MNFADIAKLKVKNIKAGRLFYIRSKVGKAISILITDKISATIDRYTKDKKSTDYIFPLITEEHRRVSQIKYYRDSSNQSLKRWANKLSLNPTLCFNTARHSWATIGKDLPLPLGYFPRVLAIQNNALHKFIWMILKVVLLMELIIWFLDRRIWRFK